MAGKEIGCRIFGIKCLRNCRNHRFPRHTPFYILHFNFYILTFYSSSSSTGTGLLFHIRYAFKNPSISPSSTASGLCTL